MASRWQLLDRPAEFDSVRSTLIDGKGGGVVVIGAAGVGKTTLAHTVTASLRSDVNWVGCTESSRSIPLGVFAHRIPATGSRDPLAVLTAARESIITGPDTVIGVDDAHLLDELSSTLLHQIAIEHAGRIVATIRSGERVPDAVTALWKDDYLKRVDLDPFTKQQSIALVESVLGGTLEGLSADVMWEASSGNPLFLRHMVEGAVEAGSLAEVDGVWQMRGRTVVPSGLAALLEDRLDRVGDAAVNVLKLLALCEPLDVDALCELVGEDAVEAAELAGLILISQDGRTGRGNPLRGFPFWNLDYRLGKETAITERFKVQFAADFFNIFNHPTYLDPFLDLTNRKGFGVVTDQFVPANRNAGSRWIQLSVRVQF